MKTRKKTLAIITLMLAVIICVCGCKNNRNYSEEISSTADVREEITQNVQAQVETIEGWSVDAELTDTASAPDSEDVLKTVYVDPWGDPYTDEDYDEYTTAFSEAEITEQAVFHPDEIPDYSGEEVIVINNDEPFFTEEQKQYQDTFIELSELDELGRCGVATAFLGQETEPTEKRGDISSIHPSGWMQKEYPGGWLYNRSHLLMFALTGLNDDERNLITGTEYFNQKLMLGWESMVLSYVDNFNGHVMYRVTPVYNGNDLVAKGVLMEAYSVEFPEEATFCRFVYNIADPEWDVEIDYATGNSYLKE